MHEIFFYNCIFRYSENALENKIVESTAVWPTMPIKGIASKNNMYIMLVVTPSGVATTVSVTWGGFLSSKIVCISWAFLKIVFYHGFIIFLNTENNNISRINDRFENPT